MAMCALVEVSPLRNDDGDSEFAERYLRLINMALKNGNKNIMTW